MILASFLAASLPNLQDCEEMYLSFIKLHNMDYSEADKSQFCADFTTHLDEQAEQLYKDEITQIIPSVPILADLPETVDLRKRGLVGLPDKGKDCDCSWAMAVKYAVENALLYNALPYSNISLNYILRNTYGSADFCSGGSAPDALEYHIQHGWKTYDLAVNADFDGQYGRALWESKTPQKAVLQEENFPFLRQHLLRVGSVEEARSYIARGIAVIASFTKNVTLHSGQRLQLYNGSRTIKHYECRDGKKEYVTLSGYGKYKGVDAWLAAYSMGETYGSNGFIYFQRGRNSWCIEQEMFVALPKTFELDAETTGKFVITQRDGVNGFDWDASVVDLDDKEMISQAIQGAIYLSVALLTWLSVWLYYYISDKKKPKEENIEMAENRTLDAQV